jgi:putative oxidoreductase
MSTISRPASYAAPHGLASTVAALLATRSAAAPLVARVSLAALLFPHGAQHALGWFGGYGFRGTLGWMTDTLGFPAPAAALAITVELLAPVALLLGLGGRLAALGIVGLMLGAISTHVPNGFFMNWFGSLPAGVEGFEYHLLVIALAAVVLIDGSGALALDRRLARAARPAGRRA